VCENGDSSILLFSVFSVSSVVQRSIASLNKKSEKSANFAPTSKNMNYVFASEALRAESSFEKGKPVARRGHKTVGPLLFEADCQVAERNSAMRKFAERVVNFLKREDGPTAVEYAVMLALIIVVCITAITALGSNANKTFTTVSGTIGAAS
jgi:pilus assembly protein Flp/PilA